MIIFIKKSILRFSERILTLTEQSRHKRKVNDLKSQLKRHKELILKSPFLFTNPQFVTIGSNFYALENLKIEAINLYEGVTYNPSISIGDDVIFHSNIHIGAIGNITIGNNVLLASGIYISDHNHGYIDFRDLNIPPIKRPLSSKGEIIIEDNVWIGEHVSILGGVTIGKNSIIGSNSVVTKSCPPNSVLAGSPAKLIKSLDNY